MKDDQVNELVLNLYIYMKDDQVYELVLNL